MLRYLTLVQCVTYVDQDGDLMIKLNSFIFSKGAGGWGGGKKEYPNKLLVFWHDRITVPHNN